MSAEHTGSLGVTRTEVVRLSRLDSIEEVKKGERGSDIRQTVNERLYQNCGLILWECKNAKTYQAAWLGKLKDEMAVEKAQIGVIVLNPADGSGREFEQLGDSIWLVKPRYANILTMQNRPLIAAPRPSRPESGATACSQKRSRTYVLPS